jgi:hypothetical protein
MLVLAGLELMNPARKLQSISMLPQYSFAHTRGNIEAELFIYKVPLLNGGPHSI